MTGFDLLNSIVYIYLSNVSYAAFFTSIHLKISIMSFFRIIAWISGIVAGLLILFGALSYVLGTTILGVNHAVNFFHVANSLLLVSICTLVYEQIAWKEKE